MREDSLTPIPAERRTLTGLDIAAIWFGAAIVVSECWAGGLPALAGLGLGLGLVAIVLGRVIGNGLMAAMSGIGAETGLPTMVLTRPAFGIRGSLFPAGLNFAQLIGWTAWMYFVAMTYLDVLAVQIGLPGRKDEPAMAAVWIGALAVVCTAASFVGAGIWHKVLKYAAGAMLVLTIWMTWLVIDRHGFLGLFGKTPAGGTSLLAGTDLVIAMSVSWLPLVADYSRFAKSRSGAAKGTFWGYFVGGTWMYAVGLLVAVAVVTSYPDEIVVKTMSDAGLAPVVLGIVLVLVSTVTTTFLDIYSAVVSAQNVAPKLPVKPTVLAVGLGSAALAIFLDVHEFEPFLFLIGAVFLPVFTVVLVEHFALSGRKVHVEEIDLRGGRYWFLGGVNHRAVLAWLLGFLLYYWASGFPGLTQILALMGKEVVTPAAWPTGASLPCILATGAAYLQFNTRRLLTRRR